ncbi:RCC1 domain-containing protein [Actinoplanes palleronii]|uniref:RCC1 domain-containing protein n=1 Tax=Actinoplanes palleronii TaxID=113570 RepID=UPI001944C01A|nr:RCC1 domain-containing protein [Actinoplanes palleronii]
MYASGVLIGKTVTALAIGTSHTCAIASGAAYAWGSTGQGQLGNSSLTASVPFTVTGLPRTATSITAEELFTFAASSSAAYCRGLGASGQVGKRRQHRPGHDPGRGRHDHRPGR